MEPWWKETTWRQLGAAIDMLENALRACPEDLLHDRSKQPEFWYLAYHTLFWLDFYLSGSAEGFAPPAPFTLDEMDPEGSVPDPPCSREQLLSYLGHCREKGRATIDGLTEEGARKRCTFGWGEVSFAELLLCNMRHVQHGAAQLNLALRQTIDSAPRWVARGRNSS